LLCLAEAYLWTFKGLAAARHLSTTAADSSVWKSARAIIEQHFVRAAAIGGASPVI
jgi:hypothetical protein